MLQLPLAWMGILALAVLWTNALLVALAAWKDRSLLTRMSEAIERSCRKGTIRLGLGDADTLASFRIAQVGRAADATDVRTILFHDKSHASACFGGELTLDDGSALALETDETVDVWVPREAIHEAVKLHESSGDYPRAYDAAGKGAGYARVIEVQLAKGSDVYVWKNEEGTRCLGAFDPRPLLSSHKNRVTLFILLTLAGASIVTGMALVPPSLGLVSKLGGLLGLGYFLGITPLGVSLREKVRKPSLAFVRGGWTDPAKEPTTQLAAG